MPTLNNYSFKKFNLQLIPNELLICSGLKMIISLISSIKHNYFLETILNLGLKELHEKFMSSHVKI